MGGSMNFRCSRFVATAYSWLLQFKMVNARVHIVLVASIWIICFYVHASGLQEEKRLRANLKNETRPWKEATVIWKHRDSQIPKATIITLVVVIGLAIIGIGMYVCVRICAQPDPQVPVDLELNAVDPGAARGLDPQMIELFPMLTFSTDQGTAFGESECQICMEAFVNGENLRVLPSCRHIFHHECINVWLTSSSTECPICRHNYSGWELEGAPPDIP